LVRHSIKFILAEDARPEGDGKFTLLGVLPGEHVAVGGEPPPGMQNAAFVLSSLVCVFILTGPEGKYPARFSVIGPDKKSKILDAPIAQPIEVLKGRPAVFVTGLKPFIGASFGSYSAHLEIGNAKYKFPFVIEKALPSAKKK
jgi:hypothetical protein